MGDPHDLYLWKHTHGAEKPNKQTSTHTHTTSLRWKYRHT